MLFDEDIYYAKSDTQNSVENDAFKYLKKK